MMGEAKRKKSTLENFHRSTRQEGGGVFGVQIFRPEYLLAMSVDERWWSTGASAMAQWCDRIKNRPLCLACDHVFVDATDYPVAFSIVQTLNQTPTIMVSGVCAACGKKSDDDLVAITVEYLRKMGIAQGAG